MLSTHTNPGAQPSMVHLPPPAFRFLTSFPSSFDITMSARIGQAVGARAKRTAWSIALDASLAVTTSYHGMGQDYMNIGLRLLHSYLIM